jgi:hypothetical protein
VYEGGASVVLHCTSSTCPFRLVTRGTADRARVNCDASLWGHNHRPTDEFLQLEWTTTRNWLRTASGVTRLDSDPNPQGTLLSVSPLSSSCILTFLVGIRRARSGMESEGSVARASRRSATRRRSCDLGYASSSSPRVHFLALLISFLPLCDDPVPCTDHGSPETRERSRSARYGASDDSDSFVDSNDEMSEQSAASDDESEQAHRPQKSQQILKKAHAKPDTSDIEQFVRFHPLSLFTLS